MARWLTLAESGSFYDIEANASPILAAETLRRNLWNVAYGVLVTSATLTALGTFDRYRMRAGLPRNAVTAVVPSPFHHAEAGVLRVPDLKADPRNAAEHTAAIIRELPELVKGARGSLVLFSSRKQMQEVFDGLDRDWRKRSRTAAPSPCWIAAWSPSATARLSSMHCRRSGGKSPDALICAEGSSLHVRAASGNSRHLSMPGWS